MKVYKYKLYQSDHFSKLDKQLFIASHVYNHCIALHKRYYKLTGKFISSARIQKHITKLKKQKRFKHWKKLNSQATQDVAQRIDRAYQNFFNKNIKRPPSFQSWRKYKSITFKQTGCKFLEDGKIKILGKAFRYFKSKELKGNIKTITLKKDRVGDYWLCINTDYKEIKSRSTTGKTAGFDFGLKTFLTSSDGTEIKSPLFLFRSLNKLRKAQKRLSKKKKGSNNRRKAIKSLARLHRRIARQRRDWHYKIANQLVEKYDEVYFEDLNMSVMKKLWGKKISDLSFSSFLLILEQKCKDVGVKFVKIDRFFPSSKLCSCCGWKNVDINLRDREWKCLGCGSENDRDLNAAKNIKIAGTSAIRVGHVRRSSSVGLDCSVC